MNKLNSDICSLIDRFVPLTNEEYLEHALRFVVDTRSVRLQVDNNSTLAFDWKRNTVKPYAMVIRRYQCYSCSTAGSIAFPQKLLLLGTEAFCRIVASVVTPWVFTDATYSYPSFGTRFGKRMLDACQGRSWPKLNKKHSDAALEFSKVCMNKVLRFDFTRRNTIQSLEHTLQHARENAKTLLCNTAAVPALLKNQPDWFRHFWREAKNKRWVVKYDTDSQWFFTSMVGREEALAALWCILQVNSQ